MAKDKIEYIKALKRARNIMLNANSFEEAFEELDSIIKYEENRLKEGGKDE